MNELLEASLKLAAESAKDAFKAGYDAGYKAGAEWAINEARKIINDSPLGKLTEEQKPS